MDTSNKAILAILGLPVLAIVATMALSGQSDRAKFDRLQVGMTTAEVQAVMDPPRRRGRPRMRSIIEDDGVIELNERMVLVMEDGRLVHKKWIEKK